jgi:hypothetical protein
VSAVPKHLSLLDILSPKRQDVRSRLQWTGTVYGPGSRIVIDGGARSALRTIMIGATIDFAGTSSTTISCDPESNFAAAVIDP